MKNDLMLSAWDSLPEQRKLSDHYQQLADAADRVEIRRRLEEEADMRTRAARAEIKKLAQYLDEFEACSLISALIAAIEASPMKHKEDAQAAAERLLDGHNLLEVM